MAHHLATTNGKTAMMYAGEVPWHRLGTKLNEPATAREAIKASGLNYRVELKSLATTDRTAVPQRKGVVRCDIVSLRVKPASELRVENRPAGSDLGGFEHDGVLEEPSMSNRTSMAQFNAIGNRYRSGHSNRQITKLLGVNRETVGKYVAAINAAGTQNQPNPQTGSDEVSQREPLAIATVAKHALNGPASSCRSWETVIKDWLDEGYRSNAFIKTYRASMDSREVTSASIASQQSYQPMFRYLIVVWRSNLAKKLRSILGPVR
jgi:hypothetical protein